MRHVGQAGNVADQINDINRSMLADPSRSLGIDRLAEAAPLRALVEIVERPDLLQRGGFLPNG